MDRRISSLGNIYQLAFVVNDLDAAVAYWSGAIGAGPFYTIPRVQDLTDWAEYYGKRARIRFSATLGYWGHQQIELVVPADNSPSIYRDWRTSGRTGLHHICIEVDDLEEARQISLRAGGVVAQEVAAIGGGGGICIDMGPDAPLPYVEFYKFGPGMREIFRQMRQSALDWDGTEPLREFASLL